MELQYGSGHGKEVSVRTAQLIQLLTEIGPDIPEIARNLGQFKESVRYRYKEKILNKGFAVQAAPDHEKLGLKRLVIIIDFAELYRPYADSILTALSELAFVVNFAQTLPQRKFIVNLSVPTNLVGAIESFFQSLNIKGVLTELDILEFEWLRNVPMKAEFFDFDSGRWDYDWSSPAMRGSEAALFMPSVPAPFDYIDLLIIKELQKDANKSLKEISDELKVNYKKLAWHHNVHVIGRGLIRGYRINWMGTGYDFKIDRALHRKHKYFAVDLIVRNVNEAETIALRQRMNQLPFLWGEAAGRNYFAEFAFPVDYIVESLQYLSDTIANVRNRAEVFTIDQTNAAAFSIPYKLFSGSEKRWVFEANELTRRFDSLIVKIKEGVG